MSNNNPSGDLISRDALKKAIKNKPVEIAKETWAGLYERVIEEIDNAPTVEPEKAKVGEIVKAYTKGFDTGKAVADDAAINLEKITAEIVGIIRDVMPQIIEFAKEYSKPTPEGEWVTVKYARDDLNDPQKSKLDFVKCPFCETIHQGRHHFCSYCGARMKKEGGQT